MSIETGTDLVQFRADLKRYADIAEVDFNDRAVEQLVDVFAEQFATGTITVRTTTHDASRRSVNFRYMTPDMPHDPVAIAREHGLLPDSTHPLNKLLDEVTEKIPLWWGLDASVGLGMQKVWAFFEQPLEFDAIAALENIPASVRNHRERFTRARINKFAILGMDFRNNTMNLYSEMLTPGYFSRDEVAEMIRDMESPLPSDEELGRDTENINTYYTFDWDSPAARRLCFTVPSTGENFPCHWHPLAARFATEAPFQAAQRGMIFNTTYGPTGGYMKMEADYTGDAATRVFGHWNR